MGAIALVVLLAALVCSLGWNVLQWTWNKQIRDEREERNEMCGVYARRADKWLDSWQKSSNARAELRERMRMLINADEDTERGNNEMAGQVSSHPAGSDTD